LAVKVVFVPGGPVFCRLGSTRRLAGDLEGGEKRLRINLIVGMINQF
jgi:hypothetical protein